MPSTITLMLRSARQGRVSKHARHQRSLVQETLTPHRSATGPSLFRGAERAYIAVSGYAECSVVGSIILRISVIFVAGKPLISACFLIMLSSFAR